MYQSLCRQDIYLVIVTFQSLDFKIIKYCNGIKVWFIDRNRQREASKEKQIKHKKGSTRYESKQHLAGKADNFLFIKPDLAGPDFRKRRL